MTEAHEKYVAWQRRRNGVPIELDLSSTVLLIFDVQEYFVNSQSPFRLYWDAGEPGLFGYFQERLDVTMVPNLKRLLSAFRARSGRVIFTTVASEFEDGKDLMPRFQKWNDEIREELGDVMWPPRSSPWAQIVDDLAPTENDVVINKTTFSSFASTGLDGMLRNLGTETLVLGGLVTNRCVETTARDATDLGYRAITVDDATATYSQELQDMTMLSLMVSYGFVRDTGKVLALLDQG